MAIGYACLTLGVKDTSLKGCNLKNASPENLENLIRKNLTSLSNIIDYNIENNIKLFRISSDIIPFGSNKVNNLKWRKIFEKELRDIGEKINSSGIRVSMHPGQYTVLNSSNGEVVKNSVLDLQYHANFLDSLNVDSTNKIILHIGGVYGDKKEAIKRFEQNYKALDENIKRRLAIENDDKSYNVKEVLDIGIKLQIPVVYDNLHNKINSFDESKSDDYWIKEVSKTWEAKDGKQKIHYSQQDNEKRTGSHSTTIEIMEFMKFYDSLENKNIDIMLEVKDKNLSAIKCIYCIVPNNIKVLEQEWERYKYLVLEHSQNDYNQIRKLLKDKSYYPALEFYSLIEKAIKTPQNLGSSLNAAQHIWGYFKTKTTEKEKKQFLEAVNAIEKDIKSIKNVKNILYRLAIKNNERYVTKSYYFLTVYDNIWSNK